MQFKKCSYAALILLALLALLAGCGENKQLSSFSAALEEQEEMTLERFQENYGRARELLSSGVAPKGSLPIYDPASGAMDPAGDLAKTGLYAVRLDAEVYGISAFYVIPAGERPMTAEEYLELAQASGLTADEIVRPENAWLSLRDPGARSANRPLTQKEDFWKMYAYYETIRPGEAARPALPVTVYVGGAAPQAFFLCPASEMDEAALQGYAVALYQSLPPEVQALWQWTETELPLEEALLAARAAMAEHGGRSDEPVKDYAWYNERVKTIGGMAKTNYWLVALYYADGGSYCVNLDASTGEIYLITKLPEETFRYETPWAAGSLNGEVIYPG